MVPPEFLADFREVLGPKAPGRGPLQAVDEDRDRRLGWVLHEKVDMVILSVEFQELPLEVLADFRQDGTEEGTDPIRDDTATILGHKDQVNTECVNNVPTCSEIACVSHRLKHTSFMQILKAFRFRLEPNTLQRELFARTAGCCRVLWNLALEQRDLAWTNQRRSVGYNAQAGELGELKAFVPWMAEVPSRCLQQALRDLDRAFQNFFAGRAAYPRFKRKGQRDAFRFPDPKQFRLEGDRVFLPKAGWVEFRKSQEVLGRMKQITISRDGDHWYASILSEVEMADPVPVSGPAVGLDLGVAQAIALSTGEVVHLPSVSAAEQRRQARLQRDLARKKKGSRNRTKAQKRLARFQKRLADRRRDAMHKATTILAKNHSLIVIENLQVKNLTASAKGTVEAPGVNVRQKAGLNRVILDKAFGELRRQLEYKARWYGSHVLAVNPAYTSQRCHECDHTEAGNRTTQAKFLCLKCGHHANADVNAALNIRDLGLGVITADGASVAACGAMPSGGRRTRKSAA